MATALCDYRKSLEKGLANQGWKDSGDSVFHADGRLAEAPSRCAKCRDTPTPPGGPRPSLADVRWGSKKRTARLYRQRQPAAGTVRRSLLVRRSFHLRAGARPAQDAPAACGPRTPGHCLFAGIASPAHRQARDHGAERSLDEASFSGWGIRTVAASEARYNPMSYHNGSIWPHDNAMIALGFARYGLQHGAATRLPAMFDAQHLHGSAANARAVLRLAPTARQGSYSLSCCLRTAGLGGGRTLCDVAGLLRAGSGCDTAGGALSLSAVAESLLTLHVRGMPIGEARVDLLLRRHGSDVSVNILNRVGEAEIVTLQRGDLPTVCFTLHMSGGQTYARTKNFPHGSAEPGLYQRRTCRNHRSSI